MLDRIAADLPSITLCLEEATDELLICHYEDFADFRIYNISLQSFLVIRLLLVLIEKSRFSYVNKIKIITNNNN